MHTIIIGGFLGAGKTTVLMALARYLTERSDSPENCVVILENEISEQGVDNQLLGAQGFRVRNIFSGCICCGSSGALCQDVELIRREYNPQWLIIEATGMAYPDSIRRTLEQELAIHAGILTVVDAKRWPRVLVGLRQFVESQLIGADAVLVTKIDLIGAPQLEQVLEQIPAFSGCAPVYPVCATRLEAECDLGALTARLTA